MSLVFLKTLGRNAFFYFLGDFLIMGLGVILIPFYTRYLNPADYGIINYLLAINNFILPFLGLSVAQTISLKYFDFSEVGDFKKFFSTIFYFFIIFSAFFLIILLTIEHQYHLLDLKEMPFYPLFFVSVITAFFTQFIQLPLRIFYCQGKAIRYSLFNFFSFLLGIFFLIFFIAILQQGVWGNVQALFFRDILMTLVALLIIGKYLLPVFSWSYLRTSLKLAGPLIPHFFSIALLGLLSRLMLARLADMQAVGLFSLGFQFSSILPVIGGAVYAGLYPLFFQLYPQTDNQARGVLIRLSTVAIFLLLFVSLTLCLFAPELVYFLSTPQYYAAHWLVPLLVLGGFFYCLYFFNSISVNYLKKTYILLVCSASAALVNFVLNLFFIPMLAGQGAALATAISYVVMWLVGYCWLGRFIALPINKRQAVWSFMLAIGLSGAGILLSYYFAVSIFSVSVKIILLAVFPLVLFKFRFIDWSTALEFVKLKKKNL